MNSLRIIIPYASVGTGHARAAGAIATALGRIAPDAVVRTVDVLAFSTAAFRFSYGDMYLNFVSHAPRFIGWIYDCMDKPKPLHPGFWTRLKVALEMMSVRPFLSLICNEPWDLAINTFFLPGELIAGLRNRGRCDVPQVMVTTDFETHRNWVTPPCEHYFTATDEAAGFLECVGVPSGRASVTGIPIDPIFAVAKDQHACRDRHGLPDDRPLLLLLSGGHGCGVPVEVVLKSLLDIPLPVGIVAVAGHNLQAQERLEKVAVPHRHWVQVLGYTPYMDELLAAADLVVTKPGGLTVSEALARGVGLVLVRPIPGQEERNSDFLLENGAAIKVNHLPMLGDRVGSVLADPERLMQLKVNARRLGRPNAAFDVASRALAVIGRSPAGGQTSALFTTNGDRGHDGDRAGIRPPAA